MPSIDADQCSLSAVVRSYLSWTIEWTVMNVAAVQDSTSSDSVQPGPALIPHFFPQVNDGQNLPSDVQLSSERRCRINAEK